MDDGKVENDRKKHDLTLIDQTWYQHFKSLIKMLWKHVSLDFKVTSIKQPLFSKRIHCLNIYVSNFFGTRFGEDFERDEVFMEFVAIKEYESIEWDGRGEGVLEVPHEVV